jgi:CRISPR/Cas system-associated protein endoribonuclease Cas2
MQDQQFLSRPIYDKFRTLETKLYTKLTLLTTHCMALHCNNYSLAQSYPGSIPCLQITQKAIASDSVLLVPVQSPNKIYVYK